jgi:hypothetical protein
MGLPVVLNGVDRVDDMKIACGVGSLDLQGRPRDACAGVVRPGPMVPVDLPGTESRMGGLDYVLEKMKMFVEVDQGVFLCSNLRKSQKMAR